MERLFQFIYRYRSFFTFIVLEVVCVWLIIENNQYQGARFYNSSNQVIATLNGYSQSVRNYFMLAEVNETLAEENTILREQLQAYAQYKMLTDSVTIPDTTIAYQYQFVSAKVTNNQVDRVKNYITINKGESSGLEPGMAVISPLGVIGKVKRVSKNYSVVTSLINVDLLVSAIIRRTGHFGSIQWDGKDPGIVLLNFIPRHVEPRIGDVIVTSGYNSVYPPNVVVGTIEDFTLGKGELFYTIKVRLSQDFMMLSYVSVVKNKLKTEQDSLQQLVTEPKK